MSSGGLGPGCRGDLNLGVRFGVASDRRRRHAGRRRRTGRARRDRWERRAGRGRRRWARRGRERRRGRRARRRRGRYELPLHRHHGRPAQLRRLRPQLPRRHLRHQPLPALRPRDDDDRLRRQPPALPGERLRGGRQPALESSDRRPTEGRLAARRQRAVDAGQDRGRADPDHRHTVVRDGRRALLGRGKRDADVNPLLHARELRDHLEGHRHRHQRLRGVRSLLRPGQQPDRLGRHRRQRLLQHHLPGVGDRRQSATDSRRGRPASRPGAPRTTGRSPPRRCSTAAIRIASTTR